MSALSPSIINVMAKNGAIPLPTVAAQGTPAGATQPPVAPVSPQSYSGVVQASGAGVSTPGGWAITNPGVGTYQVVHNLGLDNHMISPAVVGATGPCGISVVRMDGNSFAVQVVDGSQNPIALPWGFTLSTIG